LVGRKAVRLGGRRSVSVGRPFVLVGGAFLDCGRDLCQWASPDFELVPWVGVPGAFGEEVVGGGRCFFGLWAWPDFELVPWVGVAGAFGEEVVGGG
jgi:hypothetical protein